MFLLCFSPILVTRMLWRIVRCELHISETSSLKRNAVAAVKCPPIGHLTMATAYLFEKLISEICSFHRIELRHRHRALLYKMKKPIEHIRGCSQISLSYFGIIWTPYHLWYARDIFWRPPYPLTVGNDIYEQFEMHWKYSRNCQKARVNKNFCKRNAFLPYILLDMKESMTK